MPFLGKTPTKFLDANVNIDGGNIDGTTIGATSAAAGTFTNLTATGTLTLPDDGISGDDVNGGTISNFASTGIDDNATSTAITIDSSQKVGIGTTSPAFGLSVESDNGSGYAALFRKSSSDPALTIQTTSSITQIQGLNSALSATNDIAMQLSGGNVGIGTASPYGELSIKSASPQLYLETVSNGNVQINFNETADQLDVMVNNSAGKIAFGTSSTERMRIDSSGNVGIGTSSPTSRLHIDGAEDRTGGVTLSAGAQNHTWFLSSDFVNVHNIETSSGAAAHTWQTNGTERMRIDSSGKVGIGTTSPSSPLTVKGTIGFEATNSTNRWSVYTYTDNTLRFNFNGSGADEVVIDSSGNVGIGTTSPSNILHISSSDPTIRLQDTDATGYCLINAASNSRIQIKADEGNNDANTTIEFHVDGSERMRIDSSGNVGIGTTTINNPLTVNLTPNTNSKTSGSAFDGGAIRLTSASGLSGTNSEMAILAGAEDSLSAGIGFARENGGNWGTQIRFYNHSTAITTTDELTERMRIDASGNLLVGTTSTNGSTSNNTITVMGSARTLHGSVTQTGAAGWYDAFTISLPGLYIVHSYIGGYAAGPGDWSNAFFVSYTGANTAYLWNLSGSGTGNIQGRINSSTTVQLNLIGGTGIVYQYRVLRVE